MAKASKRSRIYVGCNGAKGVREVFRSTIPPTEETHGHLYAAVIGPFRTRRAADFMVGCGGGGNPHVQCVADAERIAARLAKE